MCKLLQMHHTFSTPLHPQSNASVERFNRTLGAMLSMYSQTNKRQWDKYLPQVMMAYRSSVHSTTGQTPNKMVFGRDIVLPLQAIVGLPPQDSSEMNVKPPDDFVTDLREQLEEVHLLARDSLKLKQQYRKRHYDLTAKSRSFKPGDAVWVHDTTRKPGVCSKLLANWKSPYIVMRKIDDQLNLVKASATSPVKSIHIDRLTTYKCAHLPSWLISQRKTLETSQ